jgi:hypothetical protein
MTFEESYALGADPTFRARCQSGALQAATNVMSEDDGTVGHAERAAWANRVLLNPSLESQAISFGVAAPARRHRAGRDGPRPPVYDQQFSRCVGWSCIDGTTRTYTQHGMYV